ncbi:MAG: long-chain fatty acid--CoA ligase [Candidatus Heimdallarchaeota archaeon]|nr:long-chain fatty acid--CoA ligase [Candidatus Heimdallarchaeota archaeon]
MPEKIWSYCDGIPDKIEIPEICMSELFRNTVEKYPKRNATHFKGKFMTYTELEEDANRLANALQDLGIKKGDKVAILTPNTPQFLVTFFAAMSLGAVFTAISPLATSKEIRFQLQDSEAIVIITLDLYLDKIREIKDETNIETVIVSSIADALPSITAFLYKHVIGRKNPKVKGELVYKNVLKTADNKRVNTEIDSKEDVAVFQYTGGTTGVQKGAMLTHFNLIAQATILPYWDIWLPKVPDGQYKILGVLPLSHIFGLSTSFFWSISVGGCLYLVPDPRDLDALLGEIQNNGIQFMNAVPVLFQKLAEHPDINKYDLTSLYMCISGGEALPETTSQKFEKASGCILIEGYGLSESSPVTHVNPANYDKRKVGSIGIPLPNTMSMIVDIDSQKEITEFGVPGELWIRGPSVMKGYWNNKEETDNSLVKGWLRTGDIATNSEGGYVSIVDRAKDMIIVSGYKVWPNEVEEYLYTHPDINMAAVVQSKTETGEEVKAVLVAEPGSKELTQDEVKDFCKKELAPYKIPKIIEYRDELPRSPVGKVLRKELREPTVPQKVSSPSNIIKKTIKN